MRPAPTKDGDQADMSEVPEIERLQAVELRPGDVLVVTLHDGAMENRERVQEYTQARFPHTEVLVVASGVEIDVVREAHAPGCVNVTCLSDKGDRWRCMASCTMGAEQA